MLVVGMSPVVVVGLFPVVGCRNVSCLFFSLLTSPQLRVLLFVFFGCNGTYAGLPGIKETFNFLVPLLRFLQ